MIILPLDCSHSASKSGVVVRALASHQCGQGSYPGVDTMSWLSLLLVLPLAPGGFSPLRFLPLVKIQHFQQFNLERTDMFSTSSYEFLSALWVNKQQITICSKFTTTMKMHVSSLPSFYIILSIANYKTPSAR